MYKNEQKYNEFIKHIKKLLKNEVFITNCAKCGKKLELLKDSTEGQKVYCGGCWSKE